MNRSSIWFVAAAMGLATLGCAGAPTAEPTDPAVPGMEGSVEPTVGTGVTPTS